MKQVLSLILIAMALLLPTRHASAHSQSYSYISIDAEQTPITGRLEVAVRDLDVLFKLDTNGDGNITWGDVRSRESKITTDVLKGFSIASQNTQCTLTPTPVMTNAHGGETYLVFPFTSDCPTTGQLELSYSLLFKQNAQHRALVAIKGANGTESLVLDPASPPVKFASNVSTLTNIFGYIHHGVLHIWLGYDHILFMVTLLLGTVVQMRGQSLTRIVAETVKVVTAFTLSHAVALTSAALGAWRLPTPLVESLIATTIIAAAVNNIWPFMSRRIWMIALGFGLIHGMGFTNALVDLGLSGWSLVSALLGFNLGIELGQLTVVLIAVPLFAVGRQAFARPAWLATGNLMIAAMGAMWLSDRAIGTALLPF